MSRLLLVDGSGYVFRAYYGLAKGNRGATMATRAGLPTGALHVFAQMLLRLGLDEKADRVAVCFDTGEPTFRHEIDAEYKANRKLPPDELVRQFPFFEPIVRAFGFPVLRVPGVEADDVIATLVARGQAAGYAVDVFSGDKDLLQLVVPGVRVIDSLHDIVYDEARVVERFGIPPALVANYLSLLGDTSDNIPGVKGVGKKTAAELLLLYGSVNGVLAHAAEIRGKLGENLRDPAELAALERSRRLVALRRDVPDLDLGALVRGPWDGAAISALFGELELHRLLERLAAAGIVAAASRPAPLVVGRVAFTPGVPRVAASRALLDAAVVAARAAGAAGLVLVGEGRHPTRPALVGAALAVPGAAPLYAPVAHRYLGVPAQLPAAEVWDALRPLLEDASIRLFSPDAKADLHLLGPTGLVARGRAPDPALLAHALDPTRPCDLAALALVHLGHTLPPPGKEPLSEQPLERGAAVAGGEAEVALALGRHLLAAAEAAGLLANVVELEQPLQPVLAGLEAAGVAVNVPCLKAIGARLGARLGELELAIAGLAGQAVNLGSPRQVGDLLFSRLGLGGERLRKTRGGALSTDHEVLEEIFDQHPVVPLILEHRELAKLKTTYLDALPGFVQPGGRVHARYLQTAASTGRLAATSPNVQNIPVRTELGREIRRAFVAPPGSVLVSLDYSQIELRILGHLSRNPALVAAFAAGRDVHTETAALVYGVGADAVTGEQRRAAKAVNYGLGYGQTDFGLARALGVPRAEARRLIEAYFQRFAGVGAFFDGMIAAARRDGFVLTLLGRRIPVPGLTSGNHGERSAAERFTRNAPIQGGAAEILKRAMLAVDRLIRDEHLPARMILTVHDELVLEAETDEAPRVAAAAKAAMEEALPLSVPTVVDVGIGPTWADAH